MEILNGFIRILSLFQCNPLKKTNPKKTIFKIIFQNVIKQNHYSILYKYISFCHTPKF